MYLYKHESSLYVSKMIYVLSNGISLTDAENTLERVNVLEFGIYIPISSSNNVYQLTLFDVKFHRFGHFN